MRIRQAYVSRALSFFEDRFRRAFDLAPYTNPAEPAIFFGCYFAPDREIISKHEGLGVIIWGGTDITVPDNINFAAQLGELGGRFFQVATSSFIVADLCRIGVPCLARNIVALDLQRFAPCPLGPKVYFYAGSPERREVYGYRHLPELQRLLAGTEIVVCYANPPTLPHEQLSQLYRECGVGVRLTEHDGCSHTVVELGLMGRRCVWNGALPSAIPWTTIESVAEAVRRELLDVGALRSEVTETTVRAIAARDWLETESYLRFVPLYC